MSTTKTAALQDGLYVSGYDLSGDVGALDKMTVTIGEQNATGLNALARERLQLLGDGELSFRYYFTGDTSDAGSVHAHKRLRDMSGARLATYFNGTAADNLAVGVEGRQFTHDLNRSDSGALLGAASIKPDSGRPVMIGRALVRDSTQTGVASGTALDLGASHGILGIVAHIQVTAFTGTNLTMLLQGDDNSGFATPATYGTFATVTGRTSEALVVASAPERYIRWRISAVTALTSVTFSIALFPTF